MAKRSICRWHAWETISLGGYFCARSSEINGSSNKYLCRMQHRAQNNTLLRTGFKDAGQPIHCPERTIQNAHRRLSLALRCMCSECVTSTPRLCGAVWRVERCTVVDVITDNSSCHRPPCWVTFSPRTSGREDFRIALCSTFTSATVCWSNGDTTPHVKACVSLLTVSVRPIVRLIVRLHERPQA